MDETVTLKGEVMKRSRTAVITCPICGVTAVAHRITSGFLTPGQVHELERGLEGEPRMIGHDVDELCGSCLVKTMAEAVLT
jgi:hypothetical protein